MDTESPSYAMYRVLRDFGGIPYRDAAAVIVDAGAASGESTLGARIADKTFLSRRVVHASAGNAPAHADLGGAAEALAARMAKRLGEGAWGLICEHFAGPGAARMEESLSACGRDALVYRNACARVAGAGELDSRSRATLLVLLFIAAGVTADPALAASEARGYADRRLGASVRTPPPSIVKGKKRAESPAPEGLGLLRAVGSCAKPPIYEVSRGPEGTVIGSIPLRWRLYSRRGAGRIAPTRARAARGRAVASRGPRLHQRDLGRPRWVARAGEEADPRGAGPPRRHPERRPDPAGVLDQVPSHAHGKVDGSRLGFAAEARRWGLRGHQ